MFLIKAPTCLRRESMVAERNISGFSTIFSALHENVELALDEYRKWHPRKEITTPLRWMKIELA